MTTMRNTYQAYNAYQADNASPRPALRLIPTSGMAGERTASHTGGLEEFGDSEWCARVLAALREGREAWQPQRGQR